MEERRDLGTHASRTHTCPLTRPVVEAYAAAAETAVGAATADPPKVSGGEGPSTAELDLEGKLPGSLLAEPVGSCAPEPCCVNRARKQARSVRVHQCLCQRLHRQVGRKGQEGDSCKGRAKAPHKALSKQQLIQWWRCGVLLGPLLGGRCLPRACLRPPSRQSPWGGWHPPAPRPVGDAQQGRGAGNGGPHTCPADNRLRALEVQVRELQEEVSRLRGIREVEDEIDGYFLSLQDHAHKEEAPREVPSTEEWQTVTSRTRAAHSKAVAVPPVRLENKSEALATLQEKEGEEETSTEEATPHSSCSDQAKGAKQTWRRKHQVIIIGDSILRSTEGPICRQDPSTLSRRGR
ncbi:uncharacterized protein LOC132246467 [Alligator mississippiensis]|uniref:uncharacterized protein LOC132246467 n=1 Tax=Alligator mississippiensis TaxID=8496 RepID=UPI002877AD19|nr:uncharacterized protein LOC132246467 [Alligator mississippiensis]